MNNYEHYSLWVRYDDVQDQGYVIAIVIVIVIVIVVVVTVVKCTMKPSSNH